jgi:hypothetical protein
MPTKKKPELLWTRSDLFFGPEGVSKISKPSPVIAAPAPVQSSRATHASSPSPSGADYTVQELAKEWRLSPDKIRQIFRNEPGVVKLRDKDAGKKRKRTYVSLRIPREVAARVKQWLS